MTTAPAPPDLTIGPGPTRLRELVAEICAVGGWRVGAGAQHLLTFSATNGETIDFTDADAAPNAKEICRISIEAAAGVDLVIPGDEAALLVLLDHALAKHQGRTIGVFGLAGGVGTSTIAAALAWELSAALVDGDGCGPALPALLNVEILDVSNATELVSPQRVTHLPQWGNIPVVRAVPAENVCAVLSRDYDWVVVDGGRHRPNCDVAVAVGRVGVVEATTLAENVSPDILVTTQPGRKRHNYSNREVVVHGLKAAQQAIAAGWGPRPQVSHRFARSIAQLARKVNLCVHP